MVDHLRRDGGQKYPWWAAQGYLELPWFFLAWALLGVATTEALPGAWFEPAIEVHLLLGLIPGALCAGLFWGLRRRVLKMRPSGQDLRIQLAAGVLLGELLLWPLLHFPNRWLDHSDSKSRVADCISTGKTKGSATRRTVKPEGSLLRYNLPGSCVPGSPTLVRAQAGVLGFAWIP